VILKRESSLALRKLYGFLCLWLLALPIPSIADQYACFWHSNAPPAKLSFDGERATFERPSLGITQTINFLYLPPPKYGNNPSPCSLVTNTYSDGVILDTWCWKEATKQLYHDQAWFEEEKINDAKAGGTTLYNCIALD
jgi:hypothetical protein